MAIRKTSTQGTLPSGPPRTASGSSTEAAGQVSEPLREPTYAEIEAAGKRDNPYLPEAKPPEPLEELEDSGTQSELLPEAAIEEIESPTFTGEITLPNEDGWDVIPEPTKEEIDRAVAEAINRGPNADPLTKVFDKAIIETYMPEDPIPPKSHVIDGDVVMISIGRELKEHYDVVLATRDEILGAPDETGGAKAAILNATTSIIKDLAKLQMEIYNSDLISRLQQAIMNALEDVSPEIKEKVLKSLEKRLENV